MRWFFVLQELREQIGRQSRGRDEVEPDQMILIGGIIGVILAVIVIILIAKNCRMKRKHSEDLEKVRRVHIKRMQIEHLKVPVLPSVHDRRLGRNEHPEVRDQFGMNEVFDVTAGEGKDLVRIARPLVTEGAERKLSEELWNIQPIIQRKEGGPGTVTDDLTPGTVGTFGI